MMHSESDLFSGHKTHIYIPLHITLKSQPLDTWQLRHSCAVNTSDVDTLIDYDLIAKRIRIASASRPLIVGRNLDEAVILGKRPLNRIYYRPEFYVVEAQIDDNDLKFGAQLILNQNTNILSENILGMTLYAPQADACDDLIKSDTNDLINLNDRPYKTAEAVARIKKFLFDEEFWRKHTCGFQYALTRLGLPVSHPGIRALQDAVSQGREIDLEMLRDIAAIYCPLNQNSMFAGLDTLFNPQDRLMKSFFKMVCQAESIYDIVNWIDNIDHAPSLILRQENVLGH